MNVLKDDIKILKELQEEDDREQAHIDADYIISKYIPEELRKEYNKINKWYA